MKKLFLLIPALVLAIAMNADVIYITPTSPHSSNNLRQALAAAATGDIIEMGTGTYVETDNWLAIDDKEVTVRAAEEAEVIIKPQYSVRVKAPNAAAKAEFIGVKFDCSSLESSELFVASADNANQKVVLDSCEFYDWSSNNALIRSKSDRRLDVISINRCYFHGFDKSIVFVENNNLVSLSITNSTFANVSASVTDSYWAAPIYVKSTAGSVLVDHCTFYNVNSMALSYGTITVDNIANPVVSNCIFMLPASVDRCATNLKAGGDVKNCLTYNYDNWQPYGHYNTATKTNCVTANPIFEDAANGDYTLSIASLARGKGLAGEDLGAPRWYKTIAAIDVPATLRPQDVEFFSDSAGVTETDIRVVDFKVIGSHEFNNTEWAKWRIKVKKEGYYAFTLNANSTNGHAYLLSVLQTNETLIESYPLACSWGAPTSKTTDKLWLTEGEYLIKVENTIQWSEGVVTSVIAKYEGGAVTTLPGQLLGEDAVIYDNGKLKMTHDENGDLKYGDNIQPRGEYADWSIHVNADCKLTVSFNLAPASTSGHEFLVELRNNVGKIDSVEETVLTKYLDVPAAGDYTIRLINRTQWSQAILHGITFTPYVAPAALEINEAATDNSAWIANVGGAAANVQLIRTFKGGVYNSICVPFEAPMSKIKDAFGDDVELLYLEDANMSGDILNLVFANAPDFYQGTPYLIKPSADVVNPEFANVNLLAAEAASTSHTGWPASFKGTFIKQDIDANPNNLYLGTDNKLYFSNNDVTIKGLRAYFHVNISNAQQVIKHARIMKGTQVLTDVELVETENNATKSIENGQLIITIDGVRYNVMGAKIQ